MTETAITFSDKGFSFERFKNLLSTTIYYHKSPLVPEIGSEGEPCFFYFKAENVCLIHPDNFERFRSIVEDKFHINLVEKDLPL